MSDSRLQTFVEWIIGIRLQEEILQSDHDGVEVENRLPVFSQNVQAHVSLEINVGVVDLVGHHQGRNKRGSKHVLNTLSVCTLLWGGRAGSWC